MKIPARTFAAALTAAILAAGPAVCCRRTPATPASQLRVAATVFPLYDIVRELAGEDVRVSPILPPGANPHTFDPSPAAAAALAGSEVVFQIGHGLDDWGASMARSAGVATVVTVDHGITLHEFVAIDGDPAHPPRGDDPHYFLTTANAEKIAATVELALSRIAPQAAPRFRQRLSDYRRRLQRTDLEIRGLPANLPLREIATSHNAFGYFAAAYNLKVVAVFEPFPGVEPGPRDVVAFERRVRQSRLKVIFGEPQMSNEGIGAIARDLGVRLSMLDDMGGVPGRESYVDIMLFNARQIAEASRRGKT